MLYLSLKLYVRAAKKAPLLGLDHVAVASLSSNHPVNTMKPVSYHYKCSTFFYIHLRIDWKNSPDNVVFDMTNAEKC